MTCVAEVRERSTGNYHSASELDGALRLLGYQPGFPCEYTDFARQQDEEQAANHACPACGCPGMALSPYCRDVQPPSLACTYEAVCLCNECGNAAILL